MNDASPASKILSFVSKRKLAGSRKQQQEEQERQLTGSHYDISYISFFFMATMPIKLFLKIRLVSAQYYIILHAYTDKHMNEGQTAATAINNAMRLRNVIQDESPNNFDLIFVADQNMLCDWSRYLSFSPQALLTLSQHMNS